MSAPVFISPQTSRDLETVAKFFGIDMEWNKHIFRFAAQVDPKGFEAVMHAMAQAVEQDCRFGINRRMRDDINAARGKR